MIPENSIDLKNSAHIIVLDWVESIESISSSEKATALSDHSRYHLLRHLLLMWLYLQWIKWIWSYICFESPHELRWKSLSSGDYKENVFTKRIISSNIIGNFFNSATDEVSSFIRRVSGQWRLFECNFYEQRAKECLWKWSDTSYNNL